MANYPNTPGCYGDVEYRNLVFNVSYGCPGSRIRKFIHDNYHQWNVKNWIEFATREFASANSGKSFCVKYTPKDNLGALHSMEVQMIGIDPDKGPVMKNKDTDNVFAQLVMRMQIDSMDSYYRFGGGGNEFFLSGDFEAEKVDDSDWYDVKKLVLTHLCFMDRLGRKYEVFESI